MFILTFCGSKKWGMFVIAVRYIVSMWQISDSFFRYCCNFDSVLERQKGKPHSYCRFNISDLPLLLKPLDWHVYSYNLLSSSLSVNIYLCRNWYQAYFSHINPIVYTAREIQLLKLSWHIIPLFYMINNWMSSSMYQEFWYVSTEFILMCLFLSFSVPQTDYFGHTHHCKFSIHTFWKIYCINIRDCDQTRWCPEIIGVFSMNLFSTSVVIK